MTTPFRKYTHLERLGHRNCQGIDMGLVHVFPKLDGTNSSVWFDGESIQCGSRNRVLSADADNAGFYAWVNSDDPRAVWLGRLLLQCPDVIVYGEWMVPHTLKTYREETWRRFWIFDVYDHVEGCYLSYDEYAPMLTDAEDPAAKLDVIEPLCTIQDPTDEQMKAQVETNTYLIADGAGLGEGVVLKNYAWRQKGGAWAKVVRNCFKEAAGRAHGHAEKNGKFQVEVAIADEFVTPALVGKERAKVLLNIFNDIQGLSEGNEVAFPVNWQQTIEAEHRNRVIPQLLGRVWNAVIDEEMWAILKKHKGATIDFKRLQGRVTNRVKELAGDLFA